MDGQQWQQKDGWLNTFAACPSAGITAQSLPPLQNLHFARNLFKRKDQVCAWDFERVSLWLPFHYNLIRLLLQHKQTIESPEVAEPNIRDVHCARWSRKIELARLHASNAKCRKLCGHVHPPHSKWVKRPDFVRELDLRDGSHCWDSD
jgi:hypothetical protein